MQDDLQVRVDALERKVEELSNRLDEPNPASAAMDPAKQIRWWSDHAGRFKDDKVFDEISRLGGAYRDSLRPGRKGKQKAASRPSKSNKK